MVVTVEFVKLILAYVMEAFRTHKTDKNYRLLAPFNAVKRDWAMNRGLVLRLAVPAALYTLQNNLSYIALGRLSAVTFQVIQQIKIFTTALFAVSLMGRKLGRGHWLALFALMCGVVLVQLSTDSNHSPKAVVSASSSWIGFVCLLINSISSGFAGIYFERLVKMQPKTASEEIRSVWLQSIELGMFGLVFSLMVALTGGNGAHVWQKGFFHGFGQWTVMLVVLMQAIGGVLVAMVVRYADSILKAFATSAAIVLSALFSFYLLEHSYEPIFLMGASLVIAAVLLYAWTDARGVGEAKKAI